MIDTWLAEPPAPACSRILSLHHASAWSTLGFAVWLTRTPGKGEERRSHLKEELPCTWDLCIQGPSGVCWCRSTHGQQGQSLRTFLRRKRLRRKGGDKTPTDPRIFTLRFLTQIPFTLSRFLLRAAVCAPGASLQILSRVISTWLKWLKRVEDQNGCFSTLGWNLVNSHE